MVTHKKLLSLQTMLCLGLLTGSMQPELSPKALTDCYEGRDSSFKYLEFLFVEQPKDALKEHAQKAQAVMLVAATTAVIATDYWLKSSVKKEPQVDCSVKAKADGSIKASIPSSPGLQIDLSTMAGGILGLALYELYYNYLERNIKHDTLVKFLKNWNFHRQHVPAQLAPAFDELAQAFTASKSQTLTNVQVSEIFTVIQHLVTHEFANRYDNKMKNADALGVIKTITDIGKNLK